MACNRHKWKEINGQKNEKLVRQSLPTAAVVGSPQQIFIQERLAPFVETKIIVAIHAVEPMQCFFLWAVRRTFFVVSVIVIATLTPVSIVIAVVVPIVGGHLQADWVQCGFKGRFLYLFEGLLLDRADRPSQTILGGFSLQDVTVLHQLVAVGVHFGHLRGKDIGEAGIITTETKTRNDSTFDFSPSTRKSKS